MVNLFKPPTKAEVMRRNKDRPQPPRTKTFFVYYTARTGGSTMYLDIESGWNKESSWMANESIRSPF